MLFICLLGVCREANMENRALFERFARERMITFAIVVRRVFAIWFCTSGSALYVHRELERERVRERRILYLHGIPVREYYRSETCQYATRRGDCSCVDDNSTAG